MAPFQCFFVYGVLFPVNSFFRDKFSGYNPNCFRDNSGRVWNLWKKTSVRAEFLRKEKIFFRVVKKFPQ